MTLGSLYLRMGKFDLAEASYRRVPPLGVPIPGLVAVYVRTGRHAEAERVYRDAVAVEGQGRVLPYDLAQMCAVLDRKDEAFRWLDKALAARAGALRARQNWFMLDSLHADPRWAELERRIATAGRPK